MIPARPAGKFSTSRLANQDKTVDLSSYQYGLYSYFAEGNKTHEFDGPHFDPYFGQTDIKDPALLLRAKQYFENLRQERCEDSEDYQMREQSSSTRDHRPMYQRKRKKLQQLVVSVHKIPISPAIQEYLRRRYPIKPDCETEKRKTPLESVQEAKLQEFMLQFQAGASRTQSRPYSQRVSSKGAKQDLPNIRITSHCSRESSLCSNERFSPEPSPCRGVTDFEGGRNKVLENTVRAMECDTCNPDNTLHEGTPLAPSDTVIKSEISDYSDPAVNHLNPLMNIKQEIMDSSYYQDYASCPVSSTISDLGQESIAAQRTDQIHPAIPDIISPSDISKSQTTKNKVDVPPLIKQEMLDPVHTDLDLEPINYNISTENPPVDRNSPSTGETVQDNQTINEKGHSKIRKKRKKKCIPFQIKQELIDQTETEAYLTKLNDDEKEPESEVIDPLETEASSLDLNDDLKEHESAAIDPFETEASSLDLNDALKEPESGVIDPFETEESILDLNDDKKENTLSVVDPIETKALTPDLNNDKKEPGLAVKEIDLPENVIIKEEPLDADQLLMVKIFRKRVKKLKMIKVQPMVSVKDEPIDFEDVQRELESPEIKDEQEEPCLLYFDPKPPVKHENISKLKPKFVYGKRMRARATMSVSHPRRTPSIDTESEFDKAAQIDTLFSPPKSAWSNVTTLSNNHMSDDETDENAGLTAEIDKLIEAGNITSLDDTERMFNLFASTIKNIKDPTTNVFNIVLDKFKKTKAIDESENTVLAPVQTAPNQILFPMSDQEIYSQGLAVIGESKPPEEFELPTIKVEPQDDFVNDKCLLSNDVFKGDEIALCVESGLKQKSSETPIIQFNKVQFDHDKINKDTTDITPDETGKMASPSDDPSSQTLPIRIKNSLERLSNKPNETQGSNKIGSECRESSSYGQSSMDNSHDLDPGSQISATPRDFEANSIDDFKEKLPNMGDIRLRVKSPPIVNYSSEKGSQYYGLVSGETLISEKRPDSECFQNSNGPHGFMIDPVVQPVEGKAITAEEIPSSLKRQPIGDYSIDSATQSYKITPDEKLKSEEKITMSRQLRELSDAERLFDEVLADEPSSFQAPEPAYLSEPYSRSNDNFFATSSLDDFIKAPLNTNEYLVKPKPSYVRMNYHDSSESVEGLKPPAVLFSSKTDEWSQWKRNANNESFDQFQTSPWSIEDQSNPWSPQHSIYDSYFEPPSSASFEDAQKEGSRVCENNSLQPLGRRLSVQGAYNPIIERNEKGQDIIRVPVEQRTAQTQFPASSKHCPSVEVSLPILTFITQRQDNVADIGTQTNDPEAYSSYFDYQTSTPLSSVLVEPLLGSRKPPQPVAPSYPATSCIAEGSCCGTLTNVERRTTQTQYPANNSLYSSFEQSLPFIGCANPVRNPSNSYTQTEGAPLFPPWVAPGRFRRHRPVLVEPLPTIEPIGENVRTMRSSDAYSILMEQIRTSTDCSFDKFMNSQTQPNGIVSKFNKYACYAPQEGNSPDLPLTVKKNYPKKAADNVCKGKRPGILYKEVTPRNIPSEHSNRGFYCLLGVFFLVIY